MIMTNPVGEIRGAATKPGCTRGNNLKNPDLVVQPVKMLRDTYVLCLGIASSTHQAD